MMFAETRCVDYVKDRMKITRPSVDTRYEDAFRLNHNKTTERVAVKASNQNIHHRSRDEYADPIFPSVDHQTSSRFVRYFVGEKGRENPFITWMRPRRWLEINQKTIKLV